MRCIDDANNLGKRILDALLTVGGSHRVPTSVTAVVVSDQDPPDVIVDVRLDYWAETPVCCAEPGCYIPFLGSQRREVPEVMRTVLALACSPRVTIHATLAYEPGYAHTELRYPVVTVTHTYPAEHFVAG